MSKYEFDFVLTGQSLKIAEIMAALDELLNAEGVTRYCRRMTRSKHCTESELFFPNVAICVAKPRYIYYRRL